MALLNSKGQYIKLAVDGGYEVYASQEARSRTKNSTPSESILAKYRELLVNLATQEEFSYYDPAGFTEAYSTLQDEYHRYERALILHKTGESYPLMAAIYPDVEFSIPEIIEAGCLPRNYKDVEEAYLIAKERNRFGETTDV